MFGQDRNELRKMYTDAWQKHRDKRPLTPLEAQIAQVIEDHPEYHDAITGDLDRDFTVEGGQTNPFLHMGLHLGMREQISTNRPAGVATLFRALAARAGDSHDAEHRMIDCLAETLWEAQNSNMAPDEAAYLERLRNL
ncbi:MAG: DUF1841 family protein [Desulfobulbaceae bacterium]|nr:DUF1841 family protein [Desulfobulbaceae bacterium]